MHYLEALVLAPPLAAVMTECLETGAPIVRRSVEMPSTVTPSHLGVTVSPLAGPGDMRGVICLFSDLTNVVELEEQLRLKETLARLGELTAGIAHEFRNGLATIHGYSRLLDPEALPRHTPRTSRGSAGSEVSGVVTIFSTRRPSRCRRAGRRSGPLLAVRRRSAS